MPFAGATITAEISYLYDFIEFNLSGIADAIGNSITNPITNSIVDKAQTN